MRELTKIHEEVFRTTVSGALETYEAPDGEQKIRGEYVLVIKGKDPEEIRKKEQEQWENLTVSEHMDYYLQQGLEKKEAMKAVAKDRGISKREVYQALL